MAGRPSKMTEEVVSKLEAAAAKDCSVSEMCLYANISRNTYYEWMKEKPGLSDRLEQLRFTPFLKARNTIIKALDNPQYAFEYMKRKKRKEFGDNMDHTTDGKPMPILANVLNENTDVIPSNTSNEEDNGTEQEN